MRCLNCQIEMEEFDEDRYTCTGCGANVEK